MDQRDLELSSFLGIGDPLLGPSTQSLRGLNFVDQTKDELEKTYNLKSLPSLPSTGLEIKSVQEIFPRAQTNIFLGSEATERNLKDLDTSKFNVISFATHGLMANEWKNLDEPALVLTPTPNDSDYDGLLTASEIRNLDFNADLIVLSACNTAAGDGESDEGLSGLASAFIFAGAKSVMASHWSIESNTTKNLMTSFFHNLKSKQTPNKAEALRLAMQKIASQEQFSHPIFWAPFVLVGQR
ncbi:CHAT domain-containing protein [Paracoccaceae bacterium]|nr:CHAT domain-containing protein [Paracoccaceae bacterium]